MEGVPEYPLQEDGTSQLKRSSVEDAEVPELSCLTSNKLRNDGHQFMEHRVDQGRSVSPTPSYLSMKSEQSMSKPINFKEQDRTQEEIVQLERSGSPTPSCVSMRSDSSMKKPINFRDGGSTERVSEGLCDPCSDDDTERRAVKFCPTCTLSYCEKHVRRHYTSAVYKTHTLVDVAEEVRSLGEERLQKPNSINVLPPPGEIRFLSVKSDSVTLRWGSPEGLEGPKIFRVTCEGDGEQRSLKVKDINKVEVTGLQPGQKYKFSVAAEGDYGNLSECVSKSTVTVVPPPGNIKVERSGAASFNLSWSKAPGMEHVPQHFFITCTSPGEEPLSIDTKDCYRTLTELQPDTQYAVGVSTVLMNDEQSEPASETISTTVPAPLKLTVALVDPTSATLSWVPPGGMDQTQLQYQVSYQCPGGKQHTTSTSSVSITLTDLRPASEYSVSVCSVLDCGTKSELVSLCFETRVAAPQHFQVNQLQPNEIIATWSKPNGMADMLHSYTTSCCSSDTEATDWTTTKCTQTFSNLRPASQYTISVSTVLSNKRRSDPVSKIIRTIIPPPYGPCINSVDTTSATLKWEEARGMDSDTTHRYEVSYQCPGTGRYITTTTSSPSITLTDLRPASEYSVSVCTELKNRDRSEPVSTTFNTKLTPPGTLTINSYRATSVRLSWGLPSMEHIKFKFRVKWDSGNYSGSIEAVNGKAELTGLEDNTKYIISVWTTDEQNKQESDPVCTELHTKLSHDSYIRNLGPKLHAEEKLSMTTILAIHSQMFDDSQASKLSSNSLLSFLRKVTMLNKSARVLEFDSDEVNHMMTNPLDIITAAFLCSDGLLQQEIAMKMSMCQFALPLLLPNSKSQDSTLMLWALRNIVKHFRPHSLKDKKGFVENSIALSELPMVSFVRLNNSSLSKSLLLNELFSNSQQSHNTFVHSNMPGGNTPRQISDGLVEISWYLPCGNPNMDVFPEAVAVANLRGDINDFQTQFQFLCETSASVFVFCDDMDTDMMVKLLHMKTPPTIVCNPSAQSYNATSFQSLPGNSITVLQRRTNNSDLVRDLRNRMLGVIENTPYKIGIEQMSSIALSLKIGLDEDNLFCRDEKHAAHVITGSAFDIANFKDKHLPLQGELLEELAINEREECKLQHVGEENLETYKSKLRRDRQLLREKQASHGVKDNMSHFITSLKNKKRSFFLRWMTISLENMTRTCLSDLRRQYIEESQSSSGKKKLTDLEEIIARSSLGTEHFLREMGQLYESKSHETQKHLQDLPEICAQLMLDGFPLELMDGDASYIPLVWITDVLTKLHSLTQSKSKIRVLSVLGVQSSGKSTLLNTMFGVQFAVSSGRCTRGAFMQLIRVEEDLKEALKCDFLMIIDTEGLKAPELAQLTNSYEHDNELATLVVGLSDITIVNIAMEDATEMKDTMQIVVHAFLRMKEVGKKPCCQFVHQNVADVSAHDMTFKDRKHFLRQLNEMTEIAARMERRKKFSTFSDILEYDPEKDSWYFPGLWHGSPPMAPVNAGYSEAVNNLKKSIIKRLIEAKNPAHTVLEFLELTKSLWKAVNYENFIFSFQNSLEADAYTRLSVEFNKWEWAFREQMHTWMRESENKISNHGTIGQQKSNLPTLLKTLKENCTIRLDEEEKKMLQNLEKYIKGRKDSPHFLVKHKNSFIRSAHLLRKETEASVKSNLYTCVEIRENMAKVEELQKTFASTVLRKVRKLLRKCKRKKQLSDKQLEERFDETWRQSVQDLSVKKLDWQDIDKDIHKELMKNLAREAGFVNEMVKNINRLDDQGKEPFLASSPRCDSSRHGNAEDNSKAQEIANMIIKQSKRFVAVKVALGTDYCNIDTLNLLNMIDKNTDKHPHLTIEFKALLKIYICGHASREFQQMHSTFLKDNDPQSHLDKYKSTYLADFKDRFHRREQCQRKAEEFTKTCLDPAVRRFVTDSLGQNIISEIVTKESSNMKFRTRTYFQFDILKKLLEEDNFTQFVCYSKLYQSFVQSRILEHIVNQFSSNSISIAKLEDSSLNKITQRIEKATMQISEKSDVCRLIMDICLQLDTELVIPKDALDAVLALNTTTDTEQFAECLRSSVRDMRNTLSKEYHQDKNVRAKLENLPLKPQDELFDFMVGCGKTCPFCKAPCEATGTGHEEHFTTMHRPEGTGTYRFTVSKKLVPDICSSSVTSGKLFTCSDTDNKPYPFKDYRSIYPDWRIQPDRSIEASDYWKHVFAKYNQQFADKFSALPADIPSGWHGITKEQALEGLEKAYRVKAQSNTMSTQ